MADAADNAPKKADKSDEPVFQVGEPVVIREDFHSKYFQGLRGTIAGPAVKGGTALPLWPVRLEVAPYETYIAGKYLRRPGDAEARSAPSRGDARRNGDAAAASGGKGSFLTRIIPWGRK